MVNRNKLPEQSNFVNFTDYSLEQPKGSRKFYAYVTFNDYSTALWSNIFTFNRSFALMLTIEKFGDCLEHVMTISIYESEN